MMICNKDVLLQTKLTKEKNERQALDLENKELQAKITDMEESVSYVELDLRNKLTKETKEKAELQEYLSTGM